MKVIAIDPGEHIGIVYKDLDSAVFGLTIEGEQRNLQLWTLLFQLKPDVVVYESFALRQSAALKLVGNKFITTEVIGVIKLYCQWSKVQLVELQPSSKEYCGFSDSPKDPRFLEIKMVRGQKITEHTRDAYRLFNYYRLFGKKLK